MWATRLISDKGLTRTDTGFDLDIRLPWYRSLPLSTFRGLELRIAGGLVDERDIRLEVNGQSYALDATDDLVDEWWDIWDSGVLHVRHDPIEPGDACEVDLKLSLAIPYGDGFVIGTRCTKTLAA